MPGTDAACGATRELVLKERELKGVEAKLRESEQAVARLEVSSYARAMRCPVLSSRTAVPQVIADEREAEESRHLLQQCLRLLCSWYAVSGSDAASVRSARAILAAFKPGELDFLCQVYLPTRALCDARY
eukprot:2723274-Rhodomonas_salina.2